MSQTISLVSTTEQISASELAVVASAINTQVSTDFGSVWQIDATVTHSPDLETAYLLPSWPIVIAEAANMPTTGEGIHKDVNDKPIAYVLYNPNNLDWTVTASHECLEMLADPYFNSTKTGPPPSILGTSVSNVDYLIEICDPCTASYYLVGDVHVSDFCYPDYYTDPEPIPKKQYGHICHNLTAPRLVLDGGYLVWKSNGTWTMLSHYGSSDITTNIPDPALTQNVGMRIMVDRFQRQYRNRYALPPDPRLAELNRCLRDLRQHRYRLAQTKVEQLRRQLFGESAPSRS